MNISYVNVSSWFSPFLDPDCFLKYALLHSVKFLEEVAGVRVFGQACFGSFRYAVGSNIDWKCVMRRIDDDNIVNGSYLKSPFAPTSRACIFCTTSFSMGTGPSYENIIFAKMVTVILKDLKLKSLSVISRSTSVKRNNLLGPALVIAVIREIFAMMNKHVIPLNFGDPSRKHEIHCKHAGSHVLEQFQQPRCPKCHIADLLFFIESHLLEVTFIIVKLIGKLQDGTVLVNKGDNEAPFEFKIDEEQVIYGLDRGVRTMKKGEVAILTIHLKYAFGSTEAHQESATIPASSTMYYDVELVSFEKVLEEVAGVRVFGQACFGSFRYAVGSNIDWKCVMRRTDDDNIVNGSYLKSPFAPTSRACIFRTTSFSMGTGPSYENIIFAKMVTVILKDLKLKSLSIISRSTMIVTKIKRKATNSKVGLLSV
ncbi:Peptidyl-prolyl cis-trans isomerase, FKBP-type [Artemisia annua]|uniref:peptidylprolyl isomerase n=1 Tax=Artemisia annua TaxID=35608 RepID=A0A2U1P5I4_ARTAN|nr:Peptidyl-prolyl cis-trans isomerase, FKBP-type [Artemisia annua]